MSSQIVPLSALLEYTPAVEKATMATYDRLKSVIPDVEWPVYAPYIAAINELKKERNAIILAHNYQTPEIFHGVADYAGDSLGLAQEGAKTDADIIVLCGVRFMGETAKILSYEKTVLIPDLDAGCSLAASITGEDVRQLKKQYPGVPVVTYVNTYADVRAETDICCTSANAVKIVESLGTDQVIFLPDAYLGHYVAAQTDVDLILWNGTCEVHEKFDEEEIQYYRDIYPDIHIIAHPECSPDVLSNVDFVGSTSGMIKHIGETLPKQVIMITECSMSDNVSIEYPDVEFIRPCNLCPHMKRITLPKILHSLQHLEYEITLDRDIAQRARTSLERMLEETVR